MKHLNQLVAVVLASVMLSSCSEENPWGNVSGEGHLSLRVEALGDVEAAVPAVRAITTDVVTPPSSLFKVSLVKEAGGYSKTWSSMDEFAKEESFPVGNYTLSVYYGDDKSQGRVLDSDFGYEHAYYYGESDVQIKEGQNTEVSLSAYLQNAIVVIEYTDAFKKYFKNYSTIVQPAGGEAINLGDNEAMNYVQPGDMNVTITATQPNGKQLTLNPATFKVEGKQMYKLRYNIQNGEVGDAVLSIEFDDSLNEEPIIINLSDELDNTRAPQVTTIGFNPDAQLAYAPGAPYSGDAKFSVVADGGIGKAVLTIKSDDVTTIFPFLSSNHDIDLCAATATQQQQLEDYGIKCIGFFHNPGKMGEVDLSGFFDKLSKGKTTFTFQVSDQYTQANEPVGFSMTAIPVEKSAVCEDGTPFAENYTDIIVGYNGPAPTIGSPFTFKIRRTGGLFDAVDVASVEACAAPATRSDDYPVKYYKYRLNLPEIAEIQNKDAFDIHVLFNDVERDAMVVPVAVVYPEHTMTYDAMAKQLRWRVAFPGLEGKAEVEAEALRTKYMSRLRVFVGGSYKASTYDADIDAYVIGGLNSETDYNVQTTMQVASTPSVFATTNSVKTEEEVGVPNGDFEQLTQKINKEIDQGGYWSDLQHWDLFGKGEQNKETYNVSEPDTWTTVNEKTCNFSSSSINTWFVVPSTYNVGDSQSGSVAMAIRSVGFDYNGTVPSRDSNRKTHPYNGKTPGDNPAHKAAGKLFLGSYSVNTSNLTETYNQGVSFIGRPKSFSGYYKYTPYGEDKGLLKIEILNGNEVVFTNAVELGAQSDWTKFNITMPKMAFGSKVTTLKIMISSSKNASESQSEEDSKISVTPITEHTQKYLGSELIIDNLTFEY